MTSTAPALPNTAGPRRRSLLAEAHSCSVCGKGATESCKKCAAKVCLSCLSSTGECNDCEFMNVLFVTRERKVPSAFSMFFRRRKQGDNTRTPERMGSSSNPASGGLLRTMFGRRPSTSGSSRTLNFENELANSPNLPPLPRTNSAPTEDGDHMKKLRTELENFQKLNEKLMQENKQYAAQLQGKFDGGKATSIPDENKAINSSSSEIMEAKARMADLQVQVAEAKNQVLQIGAELVVARERERELQQFVASMTAGQQQQQQGANPSVGGKARSAIPPCVPFPNTAESMKWLEDIRNGQYQDYWQTAQATAVITSSVTSALATNLPAIASQPSNGKPRSPIPMPPPLPPGMVPQQSNAMFAGNVPPQGRRGSAPGLLETGLHQKKKQSIFKEAVGVDKLDLKPIHWMPLDENRVKGTLFEKVNEKPTIKPDQESLSLLVGKFGKKGQKSVASGDSKAAKVEKAPRLQIMEGKRQQQIAIGLKGAFGKLKISEIRKAIVHLDTSVLSLEQVKQLIEMIPNAEEIKQYEDLNSGGQLDAAFFQGMTIEEQFFVDMIGIPRLRNRLMCTCVEYQFNAHAEELLNDVEVLAEAITVVKESKKWRDFLGICLETGNLLNDGNNGLGGAWGFSVKGLKKFGELKSCEANSRFSLMHWIAELADHSKPELFDLQEEFAIVSEALQRPVEDIKGEIQQLKKHIDTVSQEVEKCKESAMEGSAAFLKRMVPFLEKISEIFKRIQLRFEETEKSASALVVLHGESPATTSCKDLFEAILGGVMLFITCRTENHQIKISAEKSSRPTLAHQIGNAKSERTLNQKSKSERDIAASKELEMKLEKRRKPN